MLGFDEVFWALICLSSNCFLTIIVIYIKGMTHRFWAKNNSCETRSIRVRGCAQSCSEERVDQTFLPIDIHSLFTISFDLQFRSNKTSGPLLCCAVDNLFNGVISCFAAYMVSSETNHCSDKMYTKNINDLYRWWPTHQDSPLPSLFTLRAREKSF